MEEAFTKKFLRFFFCSFVNAFLPERQSAAGFPAALPLFVQLVLAGKLFACLACSMNQCLELSHENSAGRFIPPKRPNVVAEVFRVEYIQRRFHIPA